MICNTGSNKVHGGRDSKRGEIPHQVSLQLLGHRHPGAHFCGASIIQPLLLLTAAHCITILNLRPQQIRVVAGEHNLELDGETGEQIRNVSEIIMHEHWNVSSLYDNDIAILALNEPLQFDNYTKSIDIATGDEVRPGNLPY